VSEDGALVAIGYDGTADDLALIPAGGTETVIYTSATSAQIQLPEFSADRLQIAFLEGNPGSTGFDLYVKPAMASGSVRRASPTRAVSNLLNVNDFKFSLDSRYLASTGDLTTDGTFELHVFDSTNGSISPIIGPTTATMNGGAREFGWTNTGQILIRAGIGGQPARLHLCTVAGTCMPLPGTTTTFNVGALVVSADGTFAVYSSNERGTGAYDLYRVPSAGGTPMRIAPDAPNGWNPQPGSIVMSPDGQWVAVQANTTTGLGVFVFATSGAGNTITPMYVATGTIGVFTLTFSPNSSMLAVRADITIDGSYDLYAFTGGLSVPMQTPVLFLSSNGGSITDFRWTP
jgi:Tol biopolymer transport system component